MAKPASDAPCSLWQAFSNNYLWPFQFLDYAPRRLLSCLTIGVPWIRSNFLAPSAELTSPVASPARQPWHQVLASCRYDAAETNTLLAREQKYDCYFPITDIVLVVVALQAAANKKQARHHSFSPPLRVEPATSPSIARSTSRLGWHGTEHIKRDAWSETPHLGALPLPLAAIARHERQRWVGRRG